MLADGDEARWTSKTEIERRAGRWGCARPALRWVRPLGAWRVHEPSVALQTHCRARARIRFSLFAVAALPEWAAVSWTRIASAVMIPRMADLARDQNPEGWSRGAAGYVDQFENYTRLYVDDALGLLGVIDGSRLLDVAAGTGVVALRAVELGAVVMAIDFAEGMVRRLEERFRTSNALPGNDQHRVAQARVMDGQRLTFSDDTFDHAISMFGLMFFPDADAGIAEMARVVRPGGRIAIGSWDLDRYGLIGAIRSGMNEALKVTPVRPPLTGARFGSESGVYSALEACRGIENIEVHRVTYGWRFADAQDFFRKTPSWSPPMEQAFRALSEEALDRGALAFERAVAELCDGNEFMSNSALVGTATVQ